jgi:hypothetical protein
VPVRQGKAATIVHFLTCLTFKRVGDLRIRQFRIEDYPDVRRIWDESGLEIRPGDGRVEIGRELTRDRDLFLVAEERGNLVGTVLGAWDGRRGCSQTSEKRYRSRIGG